MKEVYVIKGEQGESYEQFRVRINDLIENLKGSNGILKLKFTLTETPPPKLSVIPFKKEKVSVISVVRKGKDDLSFIKDSTGFVGAYEVEEAVPVEYRQTWRMGAVTPGVCLLTLFHSRKDIEYDTFIDRWHNSHTPLSLRLHPLWNYIRNVVKRRITEDSVWYDGIVEEQVRSRRELLNPFIFFGPSDIYGEGDPFHIGSLVDMAKGGFYVRLGNGKTKSQHVYLGNIAHAHLQLSHALLTGNTKVYGNSYFMTDGPGSNFFHFFDRIVLESGYKIWPKKLWIPRIPAYILGAISEIIALVVRPIKYYNPKMSRFAVTYTCTDYTFNSDKAVRDFGFSIKYNEKEAFQRTIAYWQKD